MGGRQANERTFATGLLNLPAKPQFASVAPEALRAFLLLGDKKQAQTWMRLAVACVVMGAVVLAIRHWVGPWTAIADPGERVAWLAAAVCAGALAYAASLLLAGLRLRHLRQ